jgi:hypothetical protein
MLDAFTLFSSDLPKVCARFPVYKATGKTSIIILHLILAPVNNCSNVSSFGCTQHAESIAKQVSWALREVGHIMVRRSVGLKCDFHMESSIVLAGCRIASDCHLSNRHQCLNKHTLYLKLKQNQLQVNSFCLLH